MSSDWSICPVSMTPQKQKKVQHQFLLFFFSLKVHKKRTCLEAMIFFGDNSRLIFTSDIWWETFTKLLNFQNFSSHRNTYSLASFDEKITAGSDTKIILDALFLPETQVNMRKIIRKSG